MTDLTPPSARPQPAPTTIGSTTFQWGARTYVMGILNVTPDSFSGDGLLAKLANHNQVGVVVQANSGLPFNSRSNRDLNLDGIADADRLNGVARNGSRLGTFATVDLH